ncbi:hypothetical protein CRG98_024880, partial [Punica granatum]
MALVYTRRTSSSGVVCLELKGSRKVNLACLWWIKQPHRTWKIMDSITKSNISNPSSSPLKCEPKKADQLPKLEIGDPKECDPVPRNNAGSTSGQLADIKSKIHGYSQVPSPRIPGNSDGRPVPLSSKAPPALNMRMMNHEHKTGFQSPVIVSARTRSNSLESSSTNLKPHTGGDI